MKKVFTASILAAAVALSFSANAADISISKTADITKEASTAKLSISAFNADITFYNRQELSGGDVVYISFPKDTVLPDAAEIFVDKGNGVGSFEPVEVVDATGSVGPKIKLTVSTGSPVLNNSKTIVKLGFSDANTEETATYIPVAGNAVYSAEDGFSGDAKDTTGTNTFALTTSIEQEVDTVNTKFDGYVKRLARGSYETTKGELVAEVKLVRADADTKAVVEAESFTLTADSALVDADGDDLVVPTLLTCADGKSVSFNAASASGAYCDDGSTAATAITGTIVCGINGTDCVKDTITFNTLKTAAVTTPGSEAPAVSQVVFVNDTTLKADVGYAAFYLKPIADMDLPLTSFTISRDVEYTATPTLESNYLKDADLGQFKLDASVVNVPYLPVGYGLTPNVEIANAGSTDAEIQLEAFDQKGVAYGPVTLSKKAGKKAVTKVSEGDIETAFGLAANSKTKLSVTFVIDANAADITLAPYYRENESRVNVMSDQYKK